MKGLALALVTLCLAASAAKADAPQNPLYSQSNANPVPLQNLNFYGASKYYVESSTPAAAPVQLFVGSGFYYGMSCDSGTAGDLAVALDAASPSGLTVASTGKALGQRTLTVASSTGCTSLTCGKDAPAAPVRIKNGLVGVKSGSGGNNCTILALSDAEIKAAH